jgi:hypothetical protein
MFHVVFSLIDLIKHFQIHGEIINIWCTEDGGNHLVLITVQCMENGGYHAASRQLCADNADITYFCDTNKKMVIKWMLSEISKSALKNKSFETLSMCA